jgi:hypothetical protein
MLETHQRFYRKVAFGVKPRIVTDKKSASFTLRSGCGMIMRNMSQPDVNKMADHYYGILKELGANLDFEGMKETPFRVLWRLY